jgi:hypothetical protein
MNLIISLSIEQSGEAASHAAPPPSHSAQATTRDPAENPQENDIRKDFHGKSGRPSEFSTFEDYYEKTYNQSNSHVPTTPETSDTPWKPFGSYSEFEFAEVALEAALNKRQIDKLIKIIQRCVKKDDDFGLESHNDLTSAWKDAAAMVSPVRSI